jgi:hypothetical protein
MVTPRDPSTCARDDRERWQHAQSYRNARMAGWRAIFFIARTSSSRPGEILCQGDTPLGCGNGIRSKLSPPRLTRNERPMTVSSFLQPINCIMASRPTGIISRGRRISNSAFIQAEQLRISSGAGTRSLPPGALPGKQRMTAAKWICERIVGSSRPQNSSNQRKRVLPAVCANGRFKVGSRTPGACPMTITLLTMAPPETGGGITRGQRRQRRRRAT